MGAGMPEPGPGQHQERRGGGRQITDCRRLRRCLQKLCRALQKVRPPRRQVRRKMLRNKHPPSSNRCHFIYTFAFVCIHTSYYSLDKNGLFTKIVMMNIKLLTSWLKIGHA